MFALVSRWSLAGTLRVFRELAKNALSAWPTNRTLMCCLCAWAGLLAWVNECLCGAAVLQQTSQGQAHNTHRHTQARYATTRKNLTIHFFFKFFLIFVVLFSSSQLPDGSSHIPFPGPWKRGKSCVSRNHLSTPPCCSIWMFSPRRL